MNEFIPQNSQKSNPLPYVLLAGLLIGIILSLIMFNAPSSLEKLPTTQTPPYPSTQIPTPTTETLQIVKITPEGNIPSTARMGEPAPDFSLNTIDGNMVRLADLKGKPVLINLWATWCPPCRYEMSGIQAAYEKYADKGLVVLAINFTIRINCLK